jgi:hypothetical protein
MGHSGTKRLGDDVKAGEKNKLLDASQGRLYSTQGHWGYILARASDAERCVLVVPR